MASSQVTREAWVAARQEAREARRRRIMARGADRLAFIVGEVPSVSSNTSSSTTLDGPSTAPAGAELASSAASSRSGDAALFRLRDGSPSGQHHSAEPEQMLSAETDAKAGGEIEKDEHQELRTCDAEIEDVAASQLGTLHMEEILRPRVSDQELESRGTESITQIPLTKSRKLWLTFLTSLGPAIDATENIRVLVALLLALSLVAQSFLSCVKPCSNFPSNWALPFPVALLIATDLSMVFGAHVLGFVKPLRLTGDSGTTALHLMTHVELTQGSEMAVKFKIILKVLEMLFKSFRAFFLDISIYMTVLTTGYSLARICQPTNCSPVSL